MSKEKSGGISVIGLLGVVFVALKLMGITEVATWSWWWVTLPFWLGAAVFVSVMLAVLLFALIAALLD